MTYKLLKNQISGQIVGVTKTEWEKTDSETGDKTWLKIDIPMSEDNYEYQQYLEWKAEGNEPEPAD